MDLIGQLSQQLGVDGTQAQGLAGSLLKLVQGTVKEKLGPDAASQMGQAIPEMDGWQRAPSTTSAPQTAPDAGGGLMGALGGLMSGQEGGTGGMMSALGQAGDVAAVVSLLGRFNIDASKASLVAPLLLNFLKSRLDPALVGRILSAVPLLSGAGGGGHTPGSGGLGGLLGGLMGGGR
ncbi:DUF2780 domain-containing protein [Myxococcus sp. Y35]|uniref:DUF2780 domain-containing protein n=1 Tax=Pseudomyxococcus flavus TaxID=3115648 RepID=UPI003CE7987C